MKEEVIETEFENDAGTFPTVKSLFDQVYSQTIDHNELFNTLQVFGFPGLLSRDIRLLLLLVSLYYCTHIFDNLAKHATVRLKFISMVRHSVLIKISEFEGFLSKICICLAY